MNEASNAFAAIVGLGFIRVVSIMAGTVCIYLGYKLFVKGVYGDAGSMEGSIGQNKITLTKAAPGTFFALFGCLIICVSIYKGISYSGEDIKSGSSVNSNELSGTHTSTEIDDVTGSAPPLRTVPEPDTTSRTMNLSKEEVKSLKKK